VKIKHLKAALLIASISTAALPIFAKAATLGSWTTKSAMPMARTELAVVALNDKLWVIGGSTTNVDGLTTVEEYDPATDKWSEKAPLPKGLNHIGATTLNGKLYAIGGFSGRGPTDAGPRLHQGAADDAFEYDPKTDAWRTLPALKGRRGSPGVVAIDGKIHAIGGRKTPNDTIQTHEVFDPATNSWSDAAPLPTARDHLSIIAVDGLIHVIGGRYGDRDQNSSNHDIYDPKTNSWSSGPLLPTARSGVAYALYKGKILVVGGETNKYANTENEAYDLKSKTWTTLTPVPVGLHATTGASIGDHAYFPGGSTKNGGGAITDQLLVFTLP
jgi:N-acetylneuraminic acid mutarotase